LPPFACAVALWIAAARAIVMGVPPLPLEFILLMVFYCMSTRTCTIAPDKSHMNCLSAIDER
jgi:hypothetical protein